MKNHLQTLISSDPITQDLHVISSYHYDEQEDIYYSVDESGEVYRIMQIYDEISLYSDKGHWSL